MRSSDTKANVHRTTDEKTTEIRAKAAIAHNHSLAKSLFYLNLPNLASPLAITGVWGPGGWGSPPAPNAGISARVITVTDRHREIVLAYASLRLLHNEI